MITAERSPAATNIPIAAMLELIKADVFVIGHFYYLCASLDITGLGNGHLSVLLSALQWVLFISYCHFFHFSIKADLLEISSP